MTSHTSSQSHTLTFSQLVGTFTVDKELLGAQDPYVIFEAGGNKCQTKAIKSVGASTCEWKETYELKEFSAKGAVKEAASKASSGSHRHGSTVLEVTAYNHNTLRPDGTIGSGTVDLARLGSSQLSGSGDRVTVHLTDKKGKSVGELKFLIHGGGYQGAGASSGSGYGTLGVSQGSSATGYGHSQGSDATRGGDYNSSGRPITGTGEGATHGAAHQAARKAAHEGQDVQIQTREGVATGHPTGAGYDSSQGVRDQSRTTGVHSDQSRTTGVHDHTTIASGVRGVDASQGEVIDRKYYVASEDRPQEQALVEQYREHNPYEKEYETSVQHTGRERQVGSSIEALGTQERVVDTHHHVHAHPHEQIARALPEGAIDHRPGGEGWVQGKPGPICDTTKFAITGDVTVDKERVTNLREHREFEKEFEVKTALVGERALDNAGQVEQLNRERILLDEKKKVACENHPEVEAPRGAGITSGTHTHGSHTGQGLTGTHGSHTTGQGLTGTHGGHHSGGQTAAQGVRDAVSGHGTHGTTGQGLTGTHGTTGQGLTGTHGTTGQGYGSQGQTGQEKGMFQKVKDAVTGQ